MSNGPQRTLIRCIVTCCTSFSLFEEYFDVNLISFASEILFHNICQIKTLVTVPFMVSSVHWNRFTNRVPTLLANHCQIQLKIFHYSGCLDRILMQSMRLSPFITSWLVIFRHRPRQNLNFIPCVSVRWKIFPKSTFDPWCST